VRSSASFTSSRSIQSEMAGSSSGLTERAGGIGSLIWRIRTATGSSVSWKGTRPTNISYAITPAE
jgi:hypothetical protein